VVAATIEQLRAERQLDGRSVTVSSAPRLPNIGADQPTVQRILAPVIGNACRYGATRVDVSISHARHGVEVAIRDDGPGIVPPIPP